MSMDNPVGGEVKNDGADRPVNSQDILNRYQLTVKDGKLKWRIKEPGIVYEMAEGEQMVAVDLTGRTENGLVLLRSESGEISVDEKKQGEIYEVPDGMEVVDITDEKRWELRQDNGGISLIKKDSDMPVIQEITEI